MISPSPQYSILTSTLALCIASTIWLPCLHLVFQKPVDAFSGDALTTEAAALAARQIALWPETDAHTRETLRMQANNPEWDFMSRTYIVLALANMALRSPEQIAQHLHVMDRIIENTLRLESDRGLHYFLLSYSQQRPFRSSSGRSIFLDGEIALMLAARCMIEDKAEYRDSLEKRITLMQQAMRESTVMSGESYPNECWTFCNAIALCAMRMADALDESDRHAAFIAGWLATARAKLLDPETGLLVSSYTCDGRYLDGPEGSSIWMVAHWLQLLDPAFAADQYARAKSELSGTFLGFGYAREWPRTWRAVPDVDSGPIIPILEISAGSSGCAFVGAAAFEDSGYLQTLLASLQYGGFPLHKGGTLKYCASNQVGDAVLLYAMVQGPLWKATLERTGTTRAE